MIERDETITYCEVKQLLLCQEQVEAPQKNCSDQANPTQCSKKGGYDKRVSLSIIIWSWLYSAGNPWSTAVTKLVSNT